jgi:hypothetical protein
MDGLANPALSLPQLHQHDKTSDMALDFWRE